MRRPSAHAGTRGSDRPRQAARAGSEASRPEAIAAPQDLGSRRRLRRIPARRAGRAVRYAHGLAQRPKSHQPPAHATTYSTGESLRRRPQPHCRPPRRVTSLARSHCGRSLQRHRCNRAAAEPRWTGETGRFPLRPNRHGMRVRCSADERNTPIRHRRCYGACRPLRRPWDRPAPRNSPASIRRTFPRPGTAGEGAVERRTRDQGSRRSSTRTGSLRPACRADTPTTPGVPCPTGAPVFPAARTRERSRKCDSVFLL